MPLLLIKTLKKLASAKNSSLKDEEIKRDLMYIFQENDSTDNQSNL